MAGYPVALSLSGTALLFALVGFASGSFDMAFLEALPNRLFGTIKNTTLIAVPLFVFMGVMLEKSRLAEDLLESMADLLKGFRSGLGISVGVGGCAAGGEYGNCRCHRSDHGVDVAADHAQARLFCVSGDWYYLRHGHIGADYSAIDRVGVAGRHSLQCLSAGAAEYGNFHSQGCFDWRFCLSAPLFPV